MNFKFRQKGHLNFIWRRKGDKKSQLELSIPQRTQRLRRKNVFRAEVGSRQSHKE